MPLYSCAQNTTGEWFPSDPMRFSHVTHLYSGEENEAVPANGRSSQTFLE
jgi:hypothetical protein